MAIFNKVKSFFSISAAKAALTAVFGSALIVAALTVGFPILGPIAGIVLASVGAAAVAVGTGALIKKAVCAVSSFFSKIFSSKPKENSGESKSVAANMPQQSKGKTTEPTKAKEAAVVNNATATPAVAAKEAVRA